MKTYDFTYYNLGGEDNYFEGRFRYCLTDTQFFRIKESVEHRFFDGINEDVQLADIYNAMIKHIALTGQYSLKKLKETGIQIPIPPAMKEDFRS